MEQKFDSLDLQGYYAGLTKKEKSSLLSYLTKEYDMTCSTIRRKLAGNQGFGLNTLERMACHEAIKNENLWRHKKQSNSTLHLTVLCIIKYPGRSRAG